MESSERTLLERVDAAGFEIDFDPDGDGMCFYAAAGHQLGFSAATVQNILFDYLHRHRYDNNGMDRLQFICSHDVGGGEVPVSWDDALNLLKKDFANAMIVEALPDVLNYKVMIVTVHGTGRDDYLKKFTPTKDPSSGTLYFGHCGNHYVALKPKGTKERSDNMANGARCKTTSHSPGKKMNDKYRNILKNVREALLEDLEAVNVLGYMYDVFDQNDIDEIKSKDTRRKQCESLLDMLPRRGAEAYDSFVNALTKGKQKFLADIIKQEEIKVLGPELVEERATSAGLKGQVRELQILVEMEKKEREKLVEELNKVKGLLEIKELGPELSKERTASAGLKGQVRNLQNLVEIGKEEREKLKEELDKLKIPHSEQRVNAANGTNPLRDEKSQNSNSKLKDSSAEERETTKCAEQTDLNNNEKNEQFSTYVQGSDDFAHEGKRCPMCFGLTKEIETSKAKVETLQDIISQLECKNMEEMELFEEAKKYTGERIERHKNRIPEAVTCPGKPKSFHVESDFKKVVGLHEQEEKVEQPRAEGIENTEQKRRNVKDKESGFNKAVKQGQGKGFKTLRQEKEKLERETKRLTLAVKEKEDEINELKGCKD